MIFQETPCKQLLLAPKGPTQKAACEHSLSMLSGLVLRRNITRLTQGAHTVCS